MGRPDRNNLYVGLAVAAFGLLTLFLWIPFDVDSGLIEKARRRIIIGDALAPTLAASFVLLGGLGLVTVERRHEGPMLTRANVLHILGLLALIAAAFLIMRWAGPLVVSVFAEEPYRLLRDTIPWKYIGFFLGGTVLIAGLMAEVEGRLTARAVLIAALAAIVLMAIYDLPFEDLLLPPNGDV